MNTDTPETDQWETYYDEFYYHMWRLRRKIEKGGHDGLHINKGDEAKALCDLLNNLEARARFEAREAKKERDDLQKAVNGLCEHFGVNPANTTLLAVEVLKIERELAEARGQRDMLAAALRECREDSVELLTERDWWQHEPRGDYQQRYQETRHNAKRADAALQSLRTNSHEH